MGYNNASVHVHVGNHDSVLDEALSAGTGIERTVSQEGAAQVLSAFLPGLDRAGQYPELRFKVFPPICEHTADNSGGLSCFSADVRVFPSKDADSPDFAILLRLYGGFCIHRNGYESRDQCRYGCGQGCPWLS